MRAMRIVWYADGLILDAMNRGGGQWYVIYIV